MERAVDITRAGHDAAARATVAGVSERDVQTQIEYAFFSNGATGLSYSSIVGSGPNGAVLHWDRNDRRLQAGDLVVVDAAAEYGRYAADVTRTYPVSGRFTDEQARAYRAVYQAQEDIFAAIKPGVSMADLQKVAEASLKRAATWRPSSTASATSWASTCTMPGATTSRCPRAPSSPSSRRVPARPRLRRAHRGRGPRHRQRIPPADQPHPAQAGGRGSLGGLGAPLIDWAA